MHWLARLLDLPVSIVIVFVAALGAMLVTTIARLLIWLRSRDSDARGRLGRIAGWWALTAIFLLAVMTAPVGLIVLMAIGSAVGLHEFLRLLPPETRDDGLRPILLVAVLLHYLLIAMAGEVAVLTFIPLLLPIVLTLRQVIVGRVDRFIPIVGGAMLGLLLTVFAASHVALLPQLPSGEHDPRGWLVALVLLIAGNDIAQSWSGRLLGRRKLAPRISPNKTWEGLIGGMLFTAALAPALLLWMTPLLEGLDQRWQQIAVGIGIGLLLSPVGLLSDLCISMIKRNAGADDSGKLLGDQGGVLDRMDSLIFTAPLFFYGAQALMMWTG